MGILLKSCKRIGLNVNTKEKKLDMYLCWNQNTGQNVAPLRYYVYKLRTSHCFVAGRLLHDKSLRPEIRVRILNVLAAAALKDDVILLLHQDRREHVLMNYAHDVDRLSVEEQEALALFVSLFTALTNHHIIRILNVYAFAYEIFGSVCTSMLTIFLSYVLKMLLKMPFLHW